MSTYRFQETLEKLPIPDLVQTCNAYLEALKPLQTEQEHENTKIAVDKFSMVAIPKPLIMEWLQEVVLVII